MNNKIKEEYIELIEYIKSKFEKDENYKSKIPFLNLYYTSSKTEFINLIYEPSICIILQGTKKVEFDKKIYNLSPENFLLISSHIPAKAKVDGASIEKPYISLQIKFTLEEIYEVLKNIDLEKEKSEKKTSKSILIENINYMLLNPISRLIKLSNNKESFLTSLIIKEIIYILLTSSSSNFLKTFATEGNTANQIAKAVSEIKNSFNLNINVKKLAKKINMSESAFYAHFKKVTSMSPIQFQKKIRLEEAKEMLLNKNLEISQVAFDVGYESPSQFSREYSRMFGFSPTAHRKLLKEEVHIF